MHIESISVKNFGGLKDGTYDFVDGNNIIRGKNGAGKSSLTEAILYSLFGTSALRSSIEHAVTTGKDTLKVELQYGPYKIKRSKSSASVVGDGVKINGQAAVSAFFYDLMSIQKGTETSVLVSQQGKTAGILEGKPGEVNSLIESLAGFDQIDSLIDRVKEKFPAGNKKILEEMLEETAEKLKVSKAITLESPAPLLEKVKQGEVSLIVLEQDVKELRSNISGKEQELAQIEAGAKLKQKLYNDIEDLRIKAEELTEAHEEAVRISKEELLEVNGQQALVDDYPAAVDKWDLYQKVTGFSYDLEEWEGSLESLEEELVKEQKAQDELFSQIAATKAEHNTLAKQLANNSDKCITCGQSIAHLHEETTASIAGKIEDIKLSLASQEALFGNSQMIVNTLYAILKQQKKVSAYPEFAIDENILPWTLEWKEDIPIQPSAEAFSEAQTWIRSAERQERRVNKAIADETKHLDELQTVTFKELELQQEHDSMFVQDGSDLKEIIKALIKGHDAVVIQHKELTAEIKTNQREADRLMNVAKVLADQITELKEKVSELKEKLKRDSHNGQILKQIRKARPIVVDKIWNTVLAAVSGTFSELRQQECIVSKGEKGFEVDGLPTHRLSGSEKSILGIALRVSLRDIFSSADFLILDEPADSADEIRTASIMAAIASVQGQTITITHEELSGTMADYVLDLDE